MSEEKGAPKANQTIIIKRVKKVAGGHHGGSWKVAYADFVTAMMAFFLLMWLLAALKPAQKSGLSDYFSQVSIFDQSGVSFVQKGGTSMAAPGTDAKELAHEVAGEPNESMAGSEGERMIPYELRGKEMKAAELADAMKNEAKEALGEAADQIDIQVTSEGVRIQVVDRDGRPLFESGLGRPTALGRKAIDFVADSIRGLPNQIAIEGHTDAIGTHRGEGGNWYLSAQRALASRDLLERSGVNPQRFLSVSGHADSHLYVDNDPADPRNRRIAVMLHFPQSRAVKERNNPTPPAEVPSPPSRAAL